MMNQKTRARLTWEALRAATIAMLIAILGMAFTLLMMGAGHGTMAPALYLFSPIMLLCMILGDHSMVPTVLVLGSLVLYVVYGVVLTIGRHGEQGRSTVSWILGIHYFSAALAIPFAPKIFHWASYSELPMMIDVMGIGWIALLAIFLMLVHVVAIQYAIGVPCCSRQWARQIAFASLVALLLGASVYIVNHWTRRSPENSAAAFSVEPDRVDLQKRPVVA